MPTSPSRKLSQRFSRYIGLNEHSPWGRRAADFGIQAVKGHAPIAVKGLDFSELPVPSVTAFAATPLNVTKTDVGTPGGSPTVTASSANGYLAINPGSTADTGYNFQWNVADVPGSLMQFIASPNTTISATRDIYWGIRCAFSCGTSAWGTANSGKVFMGLAATDVNVMPAATGVITQATMDQGIGFLIGEDGVINLVTTETTGNTITQVAVASPTMATKYPDATNGTTISLLNSVNWTAAHFHDYFFHAHWGSADATSASSFVEFYLDGKLLGTISGAGKLPSLNATDLYNTLEIINGATTTGIVDMAITEILNATPRYHIS